MTDPGLYVIIAGAGKVGWNLARELLEKGHEVTCIEQDRRRYLTVEQELEHAVQYGDATELWVLERAGIQRADLVIAQIAQRRFEVPRVVARVLDPRRAAWYQEQGLRTICPTQIAIEQLERAALTDPVETS